jgi:hypothetical protein
VPNVEFVLIGDPARAKATAAQALEARKFKLSWHDDWSATAERGNKIANALAGAAAQYFRVDLRVMSASDGEQSIVRIDQKSSGWMGGAIGASRTKKNMAALREELTQTFSAASVLVGVREL